MRDHRDTAHALLRVALGLTFFLTGVKQIGAGIDGLSASSPADIFDVRIASLIAFVLPFVEALLGVLLVAGLFTGGALATAGALTIYLTFSPTLHTDASLAAQNLLTAIAVFALYYTVDHNACSLDAIRRRSAPEESHPTMLRVHTSGEDLLFGVLPVADDDARMGSGESRLFIARAEEPTLAKSAESTSGGIPLRDRNGYEPRDEELRRRGRS